MGPRCAFTTLPTGPSPTLWTTIPLASLQSRSTPHYRCLLVRLETDSQEGRYDLCLLAKGLGCVPDLWLSRRVTLPAQHHKSREVPSARARPPALAPLPSGRSVAAGRGHQSQLHEPTSSSACGSAASAAATGASARAGGAAVRPAARAASPAAQRPRCAGEPAPLRRRRSGPASPASLPRCSAADAGRAPRCASSAPDRAAAAARLRAQRRCPAAPNTAARQLRTDASYVCNIPMCLNEKIAQHVLPVLSRRERQ